MENTKNVFLPSNVTSTGILRVHIERISRIPYIQFVLPLILAKSVILFAAFIYSKPTSEALRIYGIFSAFSPLSMLAISDFLPHRKNMCLPEFYSIMLFVSSILLIMRHIFLSDFYHEINIEKKNQQLHSMSYSHSISFLMTAIIIRSIHNYFINILYVDQSRFLILVGAANIFYIFDTMLIMSMRARPTCIQQKTEDVY